mgnify:FL=1
MAQENLSFKFAEDHRTVTVELQKERLKREEFFSIMLETVVFSVDAQLPDKMGFEFFEYAVEDGKLVDVYIAKDALPILVGFEGEEDLKRAISTLDFFCSNIFEIYGMVRVRHANFYDITKWKGRVEKPIWLATTTANVTRGCSELEEGGVIEKGLHSAFGGYKGGCQKLVETDFSGKIISEFRQANYLLPVIEFEHKYNEHYWLETWNTAKNLLVNEVCYDEYNINL